MKATLLLFALSITAPLLAADASRILLSDTSVSVEEASATGSARAVVGDLNITADSITLDRLKNVLKCEGNVAIRTPAGEITAKDCIVELIPGEKRVTYLSRSEIRTVPKMEPTDILLAPRPKQ